MADVENNQNGNGNGGHEPREKWGSKIGLILAMAGNAIGLGNFLRFPCKAASNGGGAFMIPYFIAFLFLGIPLMWVEWALGRFGGKKGHGTIPAIFDRILKMPFSKYLGAMGIVLPLLIVIYYNYIESWTLSYSYFSIVGEYDNAKNRDSMGAFLNGYTGIKSETNVFEPKKDKEPGFYAAATSEISIPFTKFYGDGVYNLKYSMTLEGGKAISGATSFLVNPNGKKIAPPETKQQPPPEIASITPAAGEALKEIPKEVRIKLNSPAKLSELKCEYSWNNNYFKGLYMAVFFFVITFLLNMYVMYKGVESGIETLAKIGMPILFVFAIILAIRVVTLGTPINPEWNIAEGLGFIWNPKFEMLGQSGIWLAAAGQIFFTLSICTGAIQTYASFLKDSDDVVLSGATTAVTNEFAEVILGGTIAIPAAVMFFGPAETVKIASAGSFNLGFCSMPLIFEQIPWGSILGAMWFGLLFFAGITSSVALAYPAVIFLKDELDWSHKKAVSFIGFIMFTGAIPVMLFYDKGFLDEMDFWAGTFGLAFFGFVELVFFCWIFGMDNAWNEMHLGCNMRIPHVFYYITKYVTPVYIFVLMGAWGYQEGYEKLLMSEVPEANAPYLWGARVMMVAIFLIFAFFIKIAWDKKAKRHHEEVKA